MGFSLPATWGLMLSLKSTALVPGQTLHQDMWQHLHVHISTPSQTPQTSAGVQSCCCRSSDSMHCFLQKIFSEGKRLVRTILALGSGIREADRQRPGRAPEHSSPSPIQPVSGQPLPGNCELWAPPAAGNRAAAILRQCEQALADILRHHHLQCLQQPWIGSIATPRERP